jgi:hypothetical protein
MYVRTILTVLLVATDKVTQSGGDGRYVFAVSEMQGWRISAFPVASGDVRSLRRACSMHVLF